MKLQLISLLLGLALLCTAPAAITVPGADGSDGPLNITVDTEIDLSQAVLGDGVTIKWDTDNSANAGQGIYDPKQWAVVFKYSSVNVAAGATVTFKNHPSRAPVAWLVNGNVTIEGTVSLNGGSYQITPGHAEPGPGGFRGGVGTYSSGASGGGGFGIGGGAYYWQGGSERNRGAGGSYGTQGGNGPGTYGNQSLIPLLGGSGGASDPDSSSGGGAGGGAILIAVTQEIIVTGTISANGGSGRNNWPDRETGGGSGGGIRLVCDTLSGTGNVHALRGYGIQYGGYGRIRIERAVTSDSLTVQPENSLSLVTLNSNDTAVLWPPAGAPTAEIVSIGGGIVPADPLASIGGATNADVILPETTSVQVVVETTNVEQESQVIVRSTRRFNGNYVTAIATVDAVVSTNPLVIHWVADMPVYPGFGAMQARVIRP